VCKVEHRARHGCKDCAEWSIVQGAGAGNVRSGALCKAQRGVGGVGLMGMCVGVGVGVGVGMNADARVCLYVFVSSWSWAYMH